MSHYLVVLDQPRLDDSALREFDRLNADHSTFHVVVPTRPLSDEEKTFLEVESGPDVADESSEATAATWRLSDAVGALQERGLDVTGEIGPESPLDAVDWALDHGDYDQVVVVTDSAGMAGWVGLDLASRIERRISEPVISIVRSPEAIT